MNKRQWKKLRDKKLDRLCISLRRSGKFKMAFTQMMSTILDVPDRDWFGLSEEMNSEVTNVVE